MGGSRPSSSHVFPSPKRPLSATSGTSDAGHKPRIDPKFIADPDLWDPATPRDPSQQQRLRSGRVGSAKGRPISAPTYKRFKINHPLPKPVRYRSFVFTFLSSITLSTSDRGLRPLTRARLDPAVQNIPSVSPKGYIISQIVTWCVLIWDLSSVVILFSAASIQTAVQATTLHYYCCCLQERITWCLLQTGCAQHQNCNLIWVINFANAHILLVKLNQRDQTLNSTLQRRYIICKRTTNGYMIEKRLGNNNLTDGKIAQW